MVVRPQIQATLLTIIAGISDAVGYITMGGVFAANMTGNTVLAGIALLRMTPPAAVYSGAVTLTVAGELSTMSAASPAAVPMSL